jgi:hypothetical protein
MPLGIARLAKNEEGAFPMKTYVVDQNMMRKSSLAALIAAEPNSSFIIPDVGLVEMSKSGNWEGTMRPSSAAFAEVNNRTHVSMSIGKALDLELNLLAPINAQELLNAELTSFGRSSINELSSGKPAMSMQLIRATFPRVFSDMRRLDLDSSAAKARIAKLASLFKAGLKAEVIKALKSGKFYRYRLALIAAHSEQFVLDHILPKGMAPA